MKIKEVYFALNEIARQICSLAIGDHYDETKVDELLELKFRLLNCELIDDYNIADVVYKINGLQTK